MCTVCTGNVYVGGVSLNGVAQVAGQEHFPVRLGTPALAPGLRYHMGCLTFIA